MAVPSASDEAPPHSVKKGLKSLGRVQTASDGQRRHLEDGRRNLSFPNHVQRPSQSIVTQAFKVDPVHGAADRAGFQDTLHKPDFVAQRHHLALLRERIFRNRLCNPVCHGALDALKKVREGTRRHGRHKNIPVEEAVEGFTRCFRGKDARMTRGCVNG